MAPQVVHNDALQQGSAFFAGMARAVSMPESLKKVRVHVFEIGFADLFLFGFRVLSESQIEMRWLKCDKIFKHAFCFSHLQKVLGVAPTPPPPPPPPPTPPVPSSSELEAKVCL